MHVPNLIQAWETKRSDFFPLVTFVVSKCLGKFCQKGDKSSRKVGFKWDHCDSSTFLRTFLVYLTQTLTTMLVYCLL